MYTAVITEKELAENRLFIKVKFTDGTDYFEKKYEITDKTSMASINRTIAEDVRRAEVNRENFDLIPIADVSLDVASVLATIKQEEVDRAAEVIINP